MAAAPVLRYVQMYCLLLSLSESVGSLGRGKIIVFSLKVAGPCSRYIKESWTHVLDVWVLTCHVRDWTVKSYSKRLQLFLVFQTGSALHFRGIHRWKEREGLFVCKQMLSCITSQIYNGLHLIFLAICRFNWGQNQFIQRDFALDLYCKFVSD